MFERTSKTEDRKRREEESCIDLPIVSYSPTTTEGATGAARCQPVRRDTPAQVTDF
jgi:hypothetical protein